MKKLTLALILCASVFGVSAQNSRISVDYKESSVRNLEPIQSVVVAPLIADLKVDPVRISYTETEMFKDYLVTPDVVKYIADFKKIALSRAAAANSADLIIGAIVDVITNASGRLEITISGYPAKYVNFRNATPEELKMVRESQEIYNTYDGYVHSNISDKDKDRNNNTNTFNR